MAATDNDVVRVAYVKYAPPYLGPAKYIDVKLIASSVGPIEEAAKSRDGKLVETPFHPKHVKDFNPKFLYVVKTDEDSVDGKIHPYYCCIKKLGGKLT